MCNVLLSLKIKIGILTFLTLHSSTYLDKKGKIICLKLDLRVLKACADKLAEVFTIFNLSLLQSVVPSCFKSAIVPVPKKNRMSCLNDYNISLPTIAKWFEKLSMPHIKAVIPADLNP